VENSHNPGVIGIGECSLLRGLSQDDREDYEEKLQEVFHQLRQLTSAEIEFFLLDLIDWPSIRFGVEMALRDLTMGGKRNLYNTPFTTGHPIPINGLVWMGTADFMYEQILEKLERGFTCIKLKIGAIDFATELELLARIRKEFGRDTIEIRVDANGAFSPDKALEKLHLLADYNLHSIEQPIPPGRWEEMALLCEKTPLPIALDEELIGINNPTDKQDLLKIIKPQYIVLKPSLLGGFAANQEWINYAEQNKIPWWITSALESNIGLNAISQFASTTKISMPQGLGTGQLYTNNFPSPLEVKSGQIYYRQDVSWDLSLLSLYSNFNIGKIH
jgi:o-succinylbenzoate synthase